MLPHELADALASRLDAVMPAGLRVRARGEAVQVVRGEVVAGGSSAPAIVEGDPSERQLRTAAYSTISGVQDVVAEALTEPWPATSGRMPELDVRIVEGVLHAWFGPVERPVLALRPLDPG